MKRLLALFLFLFSFSGLPPCAFARTKQSKLKGHESARASPIFWPKSQRQSGLTDDVWTLKELLSKIGR